MTEELNQEKYRDMVDEILASESGMSGREMDFIEDMDKQTRRFTDKQVTWIADIWDRCCGK